MNLVNEDFGDGKVLRIEGAMTIESVDTLRAVLSQLIVEGAQVSVDVEKINETDITVLQTLCSAHRTAELLGAVLTISKNQSEVFQQLVKDTGFTRNAACELLIRQKTCLWVE